MTSTTRYFNMEDLISKIALAIKESNFPKSNVKIELPEHWQDIYYDMDETVHMVRNFVIQERVVKTLGFITASFIAVSITAVLLTNQVSNQNQTKNTNQQDSISMAECEEADTTTISDVIIPEYKPSSTSTSCLNSEFDEKVDDSSSVADSEYYYESEVPEIVIPDEPIIELRAEETADIPLEQNIYVPVSSNSPYSSIQFTDSEFNELVFITSHEFLEDISAWSDIYDSYGNYVAPVTDDTIDMMQQWMCATVLNRVLSDRFANSISGVLQEGYYPFMAESSSSYWFADKERVTRNCLAVINGTSPYYIPTDIYFEGSLEGTGACSYNGYWYTTAWGTAVTFG